MSRYFSKLAPATTLIALTAAFLLAAVTGSVKTPFDEYTFPAAPPPDCVLGPGQAGTDCPKLTLPYRADLTIGVPEHPDACGRGDYQFKNTCVSLAVPTTGSINASVSTGIGRRRASCKSSLTDFGKNCQSFDERAHAASNVDQRIEDSFDQLFGTD